MREKVISLHRSQFMNFFLIFLESFFWVRRGETVLFRRFETRLRQVLLFKKSICVYLSQSKSAKQIFKTSTTNSGLSLILLSQDSTFITSLELKKRVCGWFTTCFKSVWCAWLLLLLFHSTEQIGITDCYHLSKKGKVLLLEKLIDLVWGQSN